MMPPRSKKTPTSLEALQADRDIFRQIVEGNSDYAIFLLSLEGTVRSWNDGARRLKGYEQDEIIGSHFSLFYPEDDEDLPTRALKIATEQGRYEEEGWRVRKDGSRFWANVVITALFDPRGQHSGFSKVTRDLTQRWLDDEALRGQTAELERRVAQRTEQLTRANQHLEAFAYSVAHDLRSPLRGLQGLAAALLEDYGGALDERGRDYARTMIATAQGMEALVQKLLAYSRMDKSAAALSAVDPGAALQEVLSTLRWEVEKTGGEVSVGCDFPPVQANLSLLGQIFSNLVSNGLKFMPPGRAPKVRIEAEKRPPSVRFWVRDNGIGIAPEYQERIFGVFERLHSADQFPGNGIGLAIVAKGVRSMGGRLGVESALGEGSSFWFELPGGNVHEEPDSAGRR